MSEITRSLEASGQLNAWYQGVLRKLARQLLSDTEECIVFLGAGAAFDATRPHLPTAAELSEALAKDCKLEWHEYIPLSTIAFYYEFYFKRDELNETLKIKIGDPAVAPSTTVSRLMDVVDVLQQRQKDVLVITTNYDQHFERAYQARFGHAPDVIIYNGGTDANDATTALHVGIGRDLRTFKPKPGHTYLYKMHGCISRAEGRNLVVTEEDYINFLANANSYDDKKRLLPYVLGKIAESSTLFIGYGLSDWNFRVIFKATAERNAAAGYAVQYTHPDKLAGDALLRRQALVEFWGRKNVDIVNADAALFVEDLARAVAEMAARQPAVVVSA